MLKGVDARVFGGRALVLAALVACGTRAPEPTPSEPDEPEPVGEAPEIKPADPLPTVPTPSRVIVLTLDGVRWEDMLGSTPETSTQAMPNFHRLVKERGVAFGGAGCENDVRATGPNFVSLPGYVEIFTGRAPVCQHNYCANIETETFVDDVRKTSREGEVAVFSSWNRIGAAVAKDRKSIVLGAGARTPVAAMKDDDRLKSLFAAGAQGAGYPGSGDYRKDDLTQKIALRYLETKAPRLLVVGLGDADEYAHRGDISGYRRSITRADDFLGELDRTLGRMEDGDRTAVIITTDHGRAKNLLNHGAQAPESARVFIAGFGAGIAHTGVTCAAEPIRLAHIAGVVKQLLSVDDAEANPLADAMLMR